MTEQKEIIAKVEEFNAFPAAINCRLQNYDNYDLIPVIIDETYFLRVRGVKGWVFMKIELVPLFYVVRPDYWVIDVVGCLSGYDLPKKTKYETDFIQLTPANGAGTKGIIIREADKETKIEF